MQSYAGYTLWATLAVVAACPAQTPSPVQTPLPVQSSPVQPPPVQLLASGTTLPVSFTHGLKAGKTPVGADVTARLAQRVPLAGAAELKVGTRLVGHVVASTTGPRGELAVRLDAVLVNGLRVPLVTQAVAIASFVAVDETYEQVGAASDRGNPSPANWTTQQVGGDEVVRSGWVGPLINGSTRTVGSADFDGVYSLPENGAPAHALGVFSADAHGLYGFREQERLNPAEGLIDVFGPHVSLPGGDQVLLRVQN